ncbi:MAG: hypothetical protein WCC10_01260 [Tumebacillaceae bacterium]
MAGAKKPATKPANKPGAKKKKAVPEQQRQPQMPIVTVDVCRKCPSVCARGVAYMEKMSQPGAIGHGVPCILRRK